MRTLNKIHGGFLAVGLMAASSAAHATSGTIIFQNSTGSSISTNVIYSCDALSGTTCPSYPYQITPGSSVTLPVTTSVPSSTKFGLVGGYFTFTAVKKSVSGGPAFCLFQVTVESDYYKKWSGKVSPTRGIDAFLPYTPTCTVTGFTINSTTGVWTANLRMQ